MFARVVVTLSCAVSVALCAAAPAAAEEVFRGAPAGVEPKQGAGPAVRPERSLPFAPTPPPPVTCPMSQPSSLCNMTYHGGPVDHTNSTYLIYWEPSGYSVPAGYHGVIERYLQDVAAASGGVTNPYAIDTQYSDTTNGNILYSQTFAGAKTDTTAFPSRASSCTLQNGATACVTQSQEENELDAFLKKEGLPRGLNNIYFLILPEKVQTCENSAGWCGPYGPGTSSNEYCAYHTDFNLGNGVTAWANMPEGADGGCNVIGSPPNGASGADTLIDSLSHEHNETITDPNAGGGWYDVNTGGEIGDKCNFQMGPALGSTGTGPYDVLINGDPYEIQQEWSNAITGCAMTYGAVAPTAAFTYSPPTPQALATVSFDGSASHSNDPGGKIISYSWTFGDGATGSGATPTHPYASAGDYTVTLTVKDEAGLTASVDHVVVVGTRPTTTTYSGPTSGEYGDAVTLYGKLVDNGTSAGIAGKTLEFRLGAETCDGTTGSSGEASCSVTPLDTPGSYSVTASFAGDTVYEASSSAPTSFTLAKEESQLSYTGPTTSHYHDAFTASATLVDPEGDTPIAGKSVTFTLGVGDTCTAVTEALGKASCSITPHQTGSQNLVASFAGDSDYEPSNETKSFSITPEETTSAYTGPSVILAGSSGATLTGSLLEDGSGDNDGDGGSAAPVPPQTVTLSLGSASCTAVTDASGNLSCTIPYAKVPLGPQTVSVTFAGDAYYAASSASSPVVVAAVTKGGSFVIGKGTKVTGFAVNPPGTPSCGVSWSTNLSEEVPLPVPLPSYIAVIVSPKVTTTGSTISGLTSKVVVIKTNPLYPITVLAVTHGSNVATACP